MPDDEERKATVCERADVQWLGGDGRVHTAEARTELRLDTTIDGLTALAGRLSPWLVTGRRLDPEMCAGDRPRRFAPRRIGDDPAAGTLSLVANGEDAPGRVVARGP